METQVAAAADDARRSPRLKLPAPYTLLRVRPHGKDRFIWTGFIYDVSESGMRIELDHSLEPGTHVEVRAMLPGSAHTTICASGHIVRLHDEPDEPGPVRMGFTFDRFAQPEDRMRLSEYIHHSGIAA